MHIRELPKIESKEQKKGEMSDVVMQPRYFACRLNVEAGALQVNSALTRKKSKPADRYICLYP